MNFECFSLIFSEQGLDSIKLLPVAFAFAYFAYCAYFANSANSKYSKDILWVGAWFNQVVAFPKLSDSCEQLLKSLLSSCGKLLVAENCIKIVKTLFVFHSSEVKKFCLSRCWLYSGTLRTYLISLKYCVVFSKSAIPLEISWKPYPNPAPTTVSNTTTYLQSWELHQFHILELKKRYFGPQKVSIRAREGK